MNKINIPGFTAEVSLYKTREQYHVVGAPSTMLNDMEVLPQTFVDKVCRDIEWCLGPGSDECLSSDPITRHYQEIRLWGWYMRYC